MKRLGVVAMVVLTALAVPSVVSASVATKQKRVSAFVYAKTLCTAYKKVIDGTQKFINDVTALPTTDNATFQADATTRGLALVAKVKSAGNQLKRSYPDITGGKTVANRFTKVAVKFQDLLTKALGTFQAADPKGAAFKSDVSAFGAAVRTHFQEMDGQIGAVASKITDQGLVLSIGVENSCNKIFSVSKKGG